MSRCNSCGGIIGKDCFNPVECAYISEQQATQHDRNHYQEGYEAAHSELQSLLKEKEEEITQLKAALSKAQSKITELFIENEELKQK